MAARDGLRSAIGFPITVGTTMRGVMEFFSGQPQEPDEALLELFAAVGRQMGVFMSRKAAQDDLDRFFTLSLDMLCVARTDGYFIRVNPQWSQVTGYTETELLARPYLDFVHPEDRRSTLAAGARLAAGEPVVWFENRYRCKDDSVPLADVDVRAVSGAGAHLRVGARHHGPASGRGRAAPVRQRDGRGAAGRRKTTPRGSVSWSPNSRSRGGGPRTRRPPRASFSPT